MVSSMAALLEGRDTVYCMSQHVTTKLSLRAGLEAQMRWPATWPSFEYSILERNRKIPISILFSLLARSFKDFHVFFCCCIVRFLFVEPLSSLCLPSVGGPPPLHDGPPVVAGHAVEGGDGLLLRVRRSGGEVHARARLWVGDLLPE